MTKLLSLIVACAALIAAASPTQAQGPEFPRFPRLLAQTPVLVPQEALPPEPALPGALPPGAFPPGAVPPDAQPIPVDAGIPLFHNVKVKDPRNIAPCSVPKIVFVKDPCAPSGPCCEPAFAAVQICVPECDCPCKVVCSRDGCRVKYDYGKYSVEVTSNSRRGLITVDYDD